MDLWPINLLSWLRSILMLWVRTIVVPARPDRDLDLRHDADVCYVLRVRSLADLLVLYHHCERFGLPRPTVPPRHLMKGGRRGSYLYLQKLGWVQVERGNKATPPSPLVDLLDRVSHSQSGSDVQLVPVSIVWGRNPGKDERSLFKLLFSDDERAGILQKFLIVLAQGRDTFLNFGQPISLRQFNVDEAALTVSDRARKLRRILRVHFQSQRLATLGPAIDEPFRVRHAVLRSQSVQDMVRAEALRTGQSHERIEARAAKYLGEIAAIRYYSVVRFFDVVLSYIWTRIYNGVEVQNGEQLRALAEKHTLVYMPCHKSHMDYLLVLYALYYLGFIPPYTIAGINLNFWPVGPLIRRGGAVFIRRRFHGNRLYAAVFAEYVRFLLERHNSILFFPEGGRSRTGRLLPPKTGVLRMVLEAERAKPEKPIALVPVYVGYDKILEARSYLQELRGLSKRKESLRQLLRARKVLRVRHGKAYMNFGTPLILREWLAGTSDEPDGGTVQTQRVANEMMVRINERAVINPAGILASILMSVPQHSMTEDDLLATLAEVLHVMRCVLRDRADVLTYLVTPSDIVADGERVSAVRRFAHAGGDVLYLDLGDHAVMGYYRNMLMHHFALPSLVAAFLQFHDEINVDELRRGVHAVFPLLQLEYFLRDDEDLLEQRLVQVLDVMMEQGLLRRHGDRIQRGAVATQQFVSLGVFARLLGKTLERYAMTAALIAAQQSGGSKLRRVEIEEQAFKMAQRVALLTSSSELELLQLDVFRQIVDALLKLKLVHNLPDGELGTSQDLHSLAQSLMRLLSADVQDSIRRATERRGAESMSRR